jgi:predicted RNA binding protein YcfA (HicA-like mRNA interferase family)
MAESKNFFIDLYAIIYLKFDLRRDRSAGTRKYHEHVMPVRVREVIRLLEKHGWVEMRFRGSHRHFKHPERASVITVPGNEGKELAPGTLNDILKKAGLK